MERTINAQSTTVYSLIQPSTLLRELPMLIGFNLLLVACSYVSFNLPFSPVPITGQTFGVLLIAMALGRIRGTAVVTAYLLEGIAGLPVFAGGAAGLQAVAGISGGYLIGFLGATYLTGLLADIGWDKSYLKSIAAMTLGTAVIFICGLAWLGKFIPMADILPLGLYPFIPGAILKISIAAIILPSIWKFLRGHNAE